MFTSWDLPRFSVICVVCWCSVRMFSWHASLKPIALLFLFRLHWSPFLSSSSNSLANFPFYFFVSLSPPFFSVSLSPVCLVVYLGLFVVVVFPLLPLYFPVSLSFRPPFQFLIEKRIVGDSDFAWHALELFIDLVSFLSASRYRSQGNVLVNDGCKAQEMEAKRYEWERKK